MTSREIAKEIVEILSDRLSQFDDGNTDFPYPVMVATRDYCFVQVVGHTIWDGEDRDFPLIEDSCDATIGVELGHAEEELDKLIENLQILRGRTK